jgi:hypothetical protein
MLLELQAKHISEACIKDTTALAARTQQLVVVCVGEL